MMQREAIIAECRVKHGVMEIGDECAKSIVQLMSGYADRATCDAAMAFVTHGTFPPDDINDGTVTLNGETKLWRMLFANYTYMPADDRIMGDMLGTWLVQHSLKRRP